MEPFRRIGNTARTGLIGPGTWYRFAAFSLCLLVVAAAPLRAQQLRPGMQRGQRAAIPDSMITLDFQDLELGYVLSALAQAGGLNLVYHDLPSKAVTMRTSQPIPRSDIPRVIHALAAANGLAVTEEGGFLSVVGGLADPDPRQLYIYRLRHARAATLAGTLQTVFGGNAASTGNTRASGLPQTLSGQLQLLQQAASATGRPGTVVYTGMGGLQMDVLIVPEEVTNSLLIRAAPADWEIVQQALEALDLRPLQVVIEVLITEVRRTDDLDLGIGLTAERSTPGSQGVLDQPNPTAERADTFLLNITGVGNVDIQASLAALAATGEVRILSRPVIIAQNNQPARIIVGSQQPFIQSSQLLVGDVTGTPYQTVQYREVGTVLNILKPSCWP